MWPPGAPCRCTVASVAAATPGAFAARVAVHWVAAALGDLRQSRHALRSPREAPCCASGA